MANLGWIPPSQRTQAQNDAHVACMAKQPRFAMAPQDLASGEMVILSDFWGKPEVVADTGMTFDRAPFHQLTGSCVGAGGGNALYTLTCVQRCIADAPTKAFIPWWGFNYGRSRLYMGDRGQGEGSMGSTFAKSLIEDGVIPSTEKGLPGYQQKDGLELTERQEYEWSDGDSRLVMDYMDEAKVHPLGSAPEIRTVAEMKSAVINGYPGSFACSRYIGDASMQGSGENAAVVGRWNSSGGHQQWFFGYWNNPQLGPLFAIGNNWPRNTYPKDQHLPLVCCWVKEEDVTRAFSYEAEVFPFSHLNYLPAQPAVLDWIM